MSINLVKDIEAKLSKSKKELEQIWVENIFAITDHECTNDDTDEDIYKYRISNIQDKFDNILYIDVDVKDMQMYVENHGWVDVLTDFDETSIVFITNTVTKFRKLLSLPKTEKTPAELDKDIDATKMRDMFLESILPDLKKAIDKKVSYIYIEGYCSDDMKKYFKNKGLLTDYIHSAGKTKIYF